jgi:hypothetical protein
MEALAVRAVTRLSHLPSEQAETAWKAFKRGLSRRVPAYAAYKVTQRVEDLRRMAR